MSLCFIWAWENTPVCLIRHLSPGHHHVSPRYRTHCYNASADKFPYCMLLSFKQNQAFIWKMVLCSTAFYESQSKYPLPVLMCNKTCKWAQLIGTTQWSFWYVDSRTSGEKPPLPDTPMPSFSFCNFWAHKIPHPRHYDWTFFCFVFSF